jgi:hypothetical protein
MKKLYEKMNPGENLSWCRPFVDEDGKYAIAVNEGQIVSMILNGEEQSDITDDLVYRFANDVNLNYDLYQGWSDLHIICDALPERGCSECPFRDECDAMIVDEDDEETSYKYWLNTDFHYGDYNLSAWALMKKDLETGESDIAVWNYDEDTPNFPIPEEGEQIDIDAAWDAIDAYITKKLGFLPDYEIN